MTDNEENHGAALLREIDTMGWSHPEWAERAMRHAEALIADAKSFAELVATTTVERDQARNEVMALRVAKEQAEAALVTALEQRDRARGKLLALFCKDDNCPTRLRSEDSPYVCDGCPVGAALADDPPKGGTP